MIHLDTGELRHQPYETFLRQVIRSDERSLIQDFTLTVGIVSNHGNWFTSDNQNKELKVLSESYDWLLFLTDTGLSKFIQTLIISPSENISLFAMRSTGAMMGLLKEINLRKLAWTSLPTCRYGIIL